MQIREPPSRLARQLIPSQPIGEILTCGGRDSMRTNRTPARRFHRPMACETGRAFDEGTAVGKMAATLGPSGWWRRWRQCLAARDGSRMLLLLLLLGSWQGPQQVGAGQTFEYLKREHSLSKPYQGEAPGARWSCSGRASGPERLGRGGRRELCGLREPSAVGGSPQGFPPQLEAMDPKGRGQLLASPFLLAYLTLEVSSRSKRRALGCRKRWPWTKRRSELDRKNVGREGNCKC